MIVLYTYIAYVCVSIDVFGIAGVGSWTSKLVEPLNLKLPLTVCLLGIIGPSL